MFKPHFAICTGTIKHKGCGENGLITTNSRKLCQKCEHRRKTVKPIKKTTAKQREKIKDNKEFYAEFIERHPTKCCDECGDPIQLGKHTSDGCFVSHIIAGSANEALYHDYRNAFLLCQTCEGIWTNGERTTMKIWPEAQRRRTELLHDHYVQPLSKKKGQQKKAIN